jgi:hypothetical protein
LNPVQKIIHLKTSKGVLKDVILFEKNVLMLYKCENYMLIGAVGYPDKKKNVKIIFMFLGVF